MPGIGRPRIPPSQSRWLFRGQPGIRRKATDDRQRDLAGHSFGGAVPTMACGVARASGALRATSSSCAKAPVVPTPVQIIMSISNAITSNSTGDC
jgi:hypothetical protein